MSSVPNHKRKYDDFVDDVTLVTCYLCKKRYALTAAHFSNATINKVAHKKLDLDAVKCISCTTNECQSKIQSEKQEKFDRKLAKQVEVFQSELVQKPVKKGKHVDPSTIYLSAPLAAPIVTEAKHFFANLVSHFPVMVGPTSGWRTVAKLAVRSDKKGLRIGLFAPGTHNIIPCNDSPSHHPSINRATTIIHQKCKAHDISGYSESTGEGLLRYLLFSVQRSTSLVQLTLVLNCTVASAPIDRLQLLCNELFATSQFHSVWCHYHAPDKHCNAITGREDNSWVCLSGASDGVLEVAPTGIHTSSNFEVPLYFPPNVFRQANIDAFSNIIKTVRAKIPRNASCLELYGGVGTIGLNCIDIVSRLVSSDENPYNKICFERSVSQLPAPYCDRASYISKSATDMLSHIPLYDLLIVDPPRKGFDEEVISRLEQYYSLGKLKTLVYISCGFKAFQRDCGRLLEVKKESGESVWRIAHAEGHVLFPGSDHIETLAIFHRN